MYIFIDLHGKISMFLDSEKKIQGCDLVNSMHDVIHLLVLIATMHMLLIDYSMWLPHSCTPILC